MPRILVTARRFLIIAASLAAVAASRSFTLHGQVGADADIDITLTEGTMFAAVASPDRRLIAIDLLGALWVLPIDGGEAKKITPDTIEARRPSWSPDSRSLAFQGYDDAWHVYTIGIDGSGLRQLTNGPFDDREPDWSRDGRRIAFSSDRVVGISSIWQVEVDTRSVRLLSGFSGNDPCWSVSDRDVVFWGRPANQLGGRLELWVASPDGPERPFAAWPAVPNGQIAGPFYQLIEPGTLCGSGRTFRGATSVGSADEDVFPMPPQWIRPGELLYTADGHIKRLSTSGAVVIPFRARLTLHRPSHQRTHRDVYSDAPRPALGIGSPAVSPDGTKVALIALGDLWLLETGRRPRQLTNDAFVELDPAWSPEGKRLAFASDRGGHMDLWVHDFSTGVDTQLSSEEDHGAVSGPAWSPDGQEIAYLVNRRALYVADVAVPARGGRELYRYAHDVGRPTWPPDGKRIAIGTLAPYTLVASEPDGINQLTLFAFASTPTGAVLLPHRSTGNRINNGPVWSRDGSRMAYVSEGALWVIGVGSDASGLGQPQRVTDDGPDSPSWQADSRHIVYLATNVLRRVSVDEGSIEDIPIGLGWRRASSDLAVVHAGAVFDGRSDTLRRNVDIVIDNGRILEVEPHRDAMHAAGRIIDASNETVMPGLIDMHAHLDSGYGEALGRLLLAYGITTVRDPEAAAFAGLEQRESYEAGLRIGPRVFLAGDPLTGARVFEAGAVSVVSERQLMMELERGSRLEYDFFSTYRRLPDKYLRRAVEYAHAQGLAVASQELFPAVALGTDVLEGLRDLGRRGGPTRVSTRNATYRDVVDLITKSRVTLIPMLGLPAGADAGAFTITAAREPSTLGDPRLSLVPPSDLDAFRADAAFWRERPQELARLATRIGALRKTVATLAAAGARLTSGSGAPAVPYGAGLHVELEQLVEAGLTPFQALRTATSDAADALGAGNALGSIEPGKSADLVLVDGDPLHDIRAARDVRGVIRAGHFYDLPALLGR